MRRILLTLFLAALFLPAFTYAASLRCQGELMSPGTIMHKVLQRCGPPLAKYLVGEIDTGRETSRGRTVLYIEEWVYGEDNGYYILRFEGGRLRSTAFERE